MLLAKSTVYSQGQAAISLREVTGPLQGRTHLNSLRPIFGSQSAHPKQAPGRGAAAPTGNGRKGNGETSTTGTL